MRNAVIVAPQPEAVEVGAKVLERGGNAIDAAVACAFAQTVVDPLMCGLGGFGSMQVFMPGAGRHDIVEFYCSAPDAVSPAMWTDEFTRQTPDGFAYLLSNGANEIGYQAICTPGALKGFEHALTNYGTMDLATVMSDAIDYAQNGFMVRSDVYNFWTQESEFGERTVFEKLQFSKTGREIYFDGEGNLKKPGDIVQNADYARTLRRIADTNSSDIFYFGEIGQEIADDMKANGGLITVDDLKSLRVSRVDPIWGSYRDTKISTSPPPGSGISMLQLLHIMENFEVSSFKHSNLEHLRVLIEAMKRMTIDKDRHMGDPNCVAVPIEKLLSKSYAAELAQEIKRGERATVTRAESPHSRETTHVTVVDAAGNIVSMTHSLGMPSGVITEGLGFMYNGTMSRFDPRPDRPGSLAPGKRRASSAAPSIVFRDSEPWVAIGAPGGSYIAPAVGQCIMNVVDFDMSVSDAVSAPRTVAVSDAVQVCNRIRRSVTRQLADEGYEIRRHWKSFAFAGVHGVRIDDGRATGGADPGLDGMALSI